MKQRPARRAGWFWIGMPRAVLPRANARGCSLAALLVSAALSACSDSAERPNAVAPEYLRALILQDSTGPRPLQVPIGIGAALANVDPPDPDSVILVSKTPAIAWGEVSGGPGIWLPTVYVGHQSPQTAVGVFSGGVRMVNVRTWEGAGVLQCSGTYGTLIGYDANGVEVARQDLSLIEPEDCSPPECPDGVTWGAEATITASGPNFIKRVELTPMSPIEFVQPTCEGTSTFTNHAGTRNFITWQAAPADLSVNCAPSALVRADSIFCAVKSSDSSSFSITHLKSTTTDGRQIVDTTTNLQATGNYSWKGLALVSTNVEVIATMRGGKVDTATSSFSVSTRIGQRLGWLDPSFPDAGFPATPPAPTYVKGRPLAAPYPGIVAPGTGYSVIKRGLGETVYMYPDPELLRRPAFGPNAGIVFVSQIPWSVDARAGVPSAGIYLGAALLSTDPFYVKQSGPSPFCRQVDMAQLAASLLGHEQRHWTVGRQLTQPIRLQAGMDSLLVFPGTPAQTQADSARAKAFRLRKAYADSMTLADSLVHLQPDSPLPPVCDMRQ